MSFDTKTVILICFFLIFVMFSMINWS